MDFILRHMNVRGFLTIAVCAAAIFLYIKLHDFARRWQENRITVSERGMIPAIDIQQDLETQKSLQLKTLYRDVNAEIATAKARGVRVDSLQAVADAALLMDKPSTRAFAMQNLNKLRLAIPQPLGFNRPADSDERLDTIPTPQSRSR